MAKRKAPKSSKLGRGGSGDGKSRGPQQFRPEPDPFKKGLQAGLNRIHQALAAISKLFATALATNPTDRLRAEMAAASEVERVLAECAGGMAVLFLLLGTQAETLAQLKQFQDLQKLWQAILSLTQQFDEFQLSSAQSLQLSRAYQLLSHCAQHGSEDAGLEAVQITVRSLEQNKNVQQDLLRIYQKGGKKKRRPQTWRESSFSRACPLTGFTILLYTRVGLLHCYIKGG